MKIGVFRVNVGPMADPAMIASFAQAAEAAGIESLWTAEHVIVPVEYDSKYPYHPSGKMAAAPETPFVDPLIALTHAAAHTRTIRLGTGVNILTQANPLLLAKQAASLDVLSGGRLLLGLGVGWLEEEFRAMGVPFARRGARADDYLRAMKAVWSGEMLDHQSEFLDWRGFKSYPLPVQRPHPPLIVGGVSEGAIRRAGRLGDGWFAATDHPDQLAAQIESLHRHARQAGRDPAEIEISIFWGGAGKGLDAAKVYPQLGVSRLIAPLPTLGEDPMAGVRQLAETFVGKL